ncbi:hypothetical protein EON65_47260 [archaeon]|nr:MAG: hypothetical protein EON65_47260 [archaeon]
MCIPISVSRSVSAFAPICNPSSCPWGLKAFGGYLGTETTEAWAQYDATLLITQRGRQFDNILLDVGTADSFYAQGQLRPESFKEACEHVQQPVTLRFQEGYDHSYYFISTFMADHISFHASRLV